MIVMLSTNSGNHKDLQDQRQKSPPARFHLVSCGFRLQKNGKKSSSLYDGLKRRFDLVCSILIPYSIANLYPIPLIDKKNFGFAGSSSKYFLKANMKLSIVRVEGKTS
jgi:hypothetical protein